MLYVIVGVIAFLLILWVTGKMAGVMEAGRSGMSWAFVAFVCSGLVSLLFSLSGLVQYPIVFLLAVTLATIVVFAFVFQLNFIGALVTYIVSSGVSAALGFLLVVIFGLEAFYGVGDLGDEMVESGSKLEEIAVAAEEVCQCGEDVDCLGRKNKRFMQMSMSIESHLVDGVRADSTLKKYMQRALQCQMQPAPYDPSKSVVSSSPSTTAVTSVVEPVEAGTGSMPSTTEAASTVPWQPEESAVDIGPLPTDGYEEITFFEAPAHLAKKVVVTHKNGKRFRGTLVKVEGEFLYLQRNEKGGEYDYVLGVNDIRHLAVRKES